MPGVFDRTDLTPRERLIAAFDMPASTPLCPYIAAAVELHDPQHPASQYARDYKTAIAARLTASRIDRVRWLPSISAARAMLGDSNDAAAEEAPSWMNRRRLTDGIPVVSSRGPAVQQ